MYQEPFLRISEEFGGKMPFYLTYPMSNVYLTEKEYEKDMERMKELYPKRMKELLAYVEEECDKLEYDGSVMYDEYPDRIGMLSICSNIKGMMPKHEEKSWLEKVIEVLLYQEFRRRRERRRRYR